MSVEYIWAPSGLGNCPFWGGGSVVVDSLLIVTPIVGFCNFSTFCCALLCVHSSFAIIMMGMRELFALLSLSSWCLVIVVWLYLTVPWVCLQLVISVFPDHIHLLLIMFLMSTDTYHNNEPVHEISNNVVCATSKGSDQPAHTRSLIRAFPSRLSIL